MLFNSWPFAVFLPIVFAFYWTVPHRFRWGLLLAASYYFYMSWNVKYVVLILFTTLISFAAGLLLERLQNLRLKKAVLFFTFLACLGVLFIFKYFNFFSEITAEVFRFFAIPLHPVTLKLLLPVGISFYTFQTLSYVIDIYRGHVKAEHHFGIYATFISFFPQLVAGPIERTENLLPQIWAEHLFNYEQATYGLKLMAWGFFKKLVVADNLAVHVDRVYGNVSQHPGFALVLATFYFTIQIYCDFSGYSDIARGTAKLMGIELMENFKCPYFSASVQEFWSRWHISLSTWFRDYVYIPLGGNRVGKLRHAFNLLVTFLVSGLWHGANWTFLAWGGVHGLAQITENRLHLEKNPRGLLRFVRVLCVFLFTTVAWVFFRANSISDAGFVLQQAFTGITDPINYLKTGFYLASITKNKLGDTVFCVLILFIYDYFSLKKDVISWISSQRMTIRYGFYFGIITLILCFRASIEAIFVYFQF